MQTKPLSALLGLVTTLALTFSPFASQAATTTAFSPGDLIRGETINTVYYFGPDGHRYVFPNEKTYFTWYPDFSKVKMLPDNLLSTLPLGRSNVTYRPGYKMVKITTDPKVYVVDQGGMLRHVGSESLAKTLYGLNWNNQIDDIPDAFFVNYKVGTEIQTVSDYNPANVKTGTPTISIDKQFDEKSVTITIGSVNNGFVPPSTTIKVGSTVTWTNNDLMAHTVTSNGFDSGSLEPNKTYSRTFNTVGSYDYHCSIHPVMQGTINVVQ